MTATSPTQVPAALHAHGQPLHTRTVAITVFQDDPGVVRAEGEILDLRKAGWVPTGGNLQTAGFIHHMKLHLWIPVDTGVIERVDVAQPHVPFEATPETRGESCRDVVPRLQALVGQSIEDAFQPKLSGCFGGPLGCSHLLTLAQAMGAMLPPAIAQERTFTSSRPPGEQIAKRAIFLDGLGTADGSMSVQIQLSDFATRPRADAATAFEQLIRHAEVQTLAEIDFENMSLREITCVERIRESANLADLAWTDRSETVAPLIGGPALSGLAGALFRLLGERTEDRLILDTLLQFAPGLIQCFAARTERLLAQVASTGGRSRGGELPKELSVGGTADSCYVWRSDGVMSKHRNSFGGG